MKKIRKVTDLIRELQHVLRVYDDIDVVRPDDGPIEVHVVESDACHAPATRKPVE